MSINNNSLIISYEQWPKESLNACYIFHDHYSTINTSLVCLETPTNEELACKSCFTHFSSFCMFSLILIDLSHEQLYHLSKFQKRFGKYENKIYEISDFMQNMLNPLTVCKQKLLNPYLPIVVMIGSFVPAWNLLTNQEAAHIDCHTQHHCIHSHLPRFMRLDSVYVCVCVCLCVCVCVCVCA